MLCSFTAVIATLRIAYLFEAALHDIVDHIREHLFFYYLAGVPLLGIVAQWLAWRLRLPSILLLLAIGVAVGSFLNPDELLARLAGVNAETSSFGSRVLFPTGSGTSGASRTAGRAERV